MLVVDDNADNLYLLRSILQGFDCAMDEARHGAEALTKARQSPPDLIISDLLMPVMDGYTLLRQWKADERLAQIPFVVYTATYTEPQDERLALELGADAFILKPAEPEPFMRRIRETLERKRSAALSPPQTTSVEEKVLLKEYSEVLIRKLENKTLRLEQVNQALQQDIDLRRQTELALGESEARLRLALDAAHMGTFDWDIPNNHITWSRGHEELWGLKFGEFDGSYAQAIKRLHPDDAPGMEAEIARCMAAHAPLLREFRVVWPDGSMHWISSWGEFAFDVNNRPLRMRGVVVDISARKEIEHKLSASEALLRTIVDSEPAGIELIGVNCMLLDINASGLALREAETRESVIHRDVAQWVVPEQRESFVQLQQHALDGTSGTLEFDMLGLKGTRRTLHTHAVPLRNSSGAVIAALGLTTDISERKRSAAEKQQLERKLQQAQKMEVIGQLTAGIAHDFNNIIASVLGYSELALDYHVADKDSKLAECLREVQNAGKRARDLITNLLTFSRAGETDTYPVQLGKLTQEAANMLKPTLPSSIEFALRVETDDLYVRANPSQLYQVIMNLVINARDALGEHGRIELVVRQAHAVKSTCAACQADVAGDFVELAVIDNGSGIAPDLVSRIFDPFFTTKAVGKGTGMGLSVVHGVVHRCGGHVLVESTPGCGTALRVLFPLTTAAVEKDAALRADAKPAGDSAASAGEARAAPHRSHILVVDDENILALLVGEVLKSKGYRVTTYSDSLQALEQFRSAPDEFDALLSDQTMPGLTGIELAQALRALRPELPIILCTGYSSALDETVAAQLNVALISKPISFPGLLLTLERSLSAARRKARNTSP